MSICHLCLIEDSITRVWIIGKCWMELTEAIKCSHSSIYRDNCCTSAQLVFTDWRKIYSCRI